MYFTSWDANVFLCLLSVFPEEVVRGMIKLVKNTHEEFVRTETLDYHCNLARHLLYLNGMHFPSLSDQELKAKWKWRCPERRRNSVVKWASSDWDWRCSHKDPPLKNPGKATSIAGYWNSGEAWYYSVNREDDYEDYEENSEDENSEDEHENTWEKYRRQYVSDWYKNIHEGRYFLFFKEHDILSSDVYDNYRLQDKKRGFFQGFATVAISALGERWQTAQDLLTIDGPGIGQKCGNHIEHIDDLF